MLTGSYTGDVARAKREWTREEWNRDVDALVEPTSEDVWITRDGRRLDTPEKVIAFFRDYNAQLAREQERSTHRASTRPR